MAVVLTLVQTKQIRVNIKKAKVFPLQARCGPEGGKRYSSTLPRPQH